MSEEQQLRNLFFILPMSALTELTGLSRTSICRVRRHMGLDAPSAKLVQSRFRTVTNQETSPEPLPLSITKSKPSAYQKGSTSSPRTRARKWTIVPSDWEPKDAHRAKARELSVDFDKELADFRLWEFKTPKSNADLAFHRWLRTAKPVASVADKGWSI